MPPRPANNVMDPSEWMKARQQRPARRSLYGALRKESNVKCLILTGLIYGCIVAIIWCRVTRVTKVDIDFTAFPITSDDGTIYIPTAFVVMLYLLYLVECWHCKAWHQLKFEKTDLNSTYQKIHEVRQAQPVVWWKAVCYHYVRRTREITRYRNGNAYTCTQVYYERVNSHVAAGCFCFALCGMKDVSRELIDLEKHAATKIQLSKGFLFANLATAREFQEQRAAFFQEQERYDDYMEMREGMDLSNVHFKESLISWASPDNPPWFAKIPVFWLCNFLLLSWPLRLILELNTAHIHYQVNKLFGVNYMTPSGSEMLLSEPRSHGLPVNNHQHRIHNRAISSHHSRLNGHQRPGNSRHRRSLISSDPDHDETAPLLSSESAQQQHDHTQFTEEFLATTEHQEPNQYFNNSNNSPSPQQQKWEKDSQQELHGGSSKFLHKDQQSSCNNNNNSNDNNNSTNHNNNNITGSSTTATITSPSSSSGRHLFFPWQSSFFSRNFRFARQSGYKLTRSVTLLMTKPERLEFLASTQHQFPGELGYFADSEEDARLLHDEIYYPSCSSPPPPPFLTPSPEEDEEQGDGSGDGRSVSISSRANNDSRSNDRHFGSVISSNHRHCHYQHGHHHPPGLFQHQASMSGDLEDGNSSPNCLAPSYSQALLLMEPNERNSVVAYFNRQENSSSDSNNVANPQLLSAESLACARNVNPAMSDGTNASSMNTTSPCNSSVSGVVVGFETANLTNEQENPAGFMNVTRMGNDRGSSSLEPGIATTAENCGAGETMNSVCVNSSSECGQGVGCSVTPSTTDHYLQQKSGSGSHQNNCPTGTTTARPLSENPPFSGNEQARNSSHHIPPYPVSQMTAPMQSQQQNVEQQYQPMSQPTDVDAACGDCRTDNLTQSQETSNRFLGNNQETIPPRPAAPARRQDSSLDSFSPVTGHHQNQHHHYSRISRLPSSGSSLVLNSMAPREMTGVQIDLTQPIVMTVPRDPLRETAILAQLTAGNSSSSSNSATTRDSHHHPQYSLRDTSNPRFGRDDEPPTYVEALRTSRPVFLPTLARIRRCFTERDIASRFSSNRNFWLDEIADVEGVASNHHHYCGHVGGGDTQQPRAGGRDSGNNAGDSSTSRV